MASLRGCDPVSLQRPRNEPAVPRCSRRPSRDRDGAMLVMAAGTGHILLLSLYARFGRPRR